VEDAGLVKLANDLLAAKVDGKFPGQTEADIDDDTAILWALDASETVGQELNPNEIYQEMEKELGELGLSDAVLKAAARKKLPGSTFCGPDRSFPVPDCAHATAARRLIGRYKGPGDKTRILGCVNRKAKALGCDSKSSDSLETKEIPVVVAEEPTVEVKDTFVVPTCEQLKSLTNEDAKLLFTSIETELLDRKLTVKEDCKKCIDAESKLAEIEAVLSNTKDEAEKSLSEVKTSSDAKVLNLENTLAVLRDELAAVYADFTHLADDMINLRAEKHRAEVDKLAIVGVLKGKFKDLQTATTELLTKDSLLTDTTLVMDGFDPTQIFERLNDGMTREPKGVVDNPANTNVDDIPVDLFSLTYSGQSAVANVRRFISEGRVDDAKRLYGKMKSLGEFPDSLTWEQLSK
jgi:pentatricopeptide repeat protein